jgi:hypothetical protein
LNLTAKNTSQVVHENTSIATFSNGTHNNDEYQQGQAKSSKQEYARMTDEKYEKHEKLNKFPNSSQNKTVKIQQLNNSSRVERIATDLDANSS